MKNEEVIKKWLNYSLNEAEQAQFNSLEDSEDLQHLTKQLQAFKAPEYATTTELQKINALKSKKDKPRKLIPTLLRVAAILVITLCVFWLVKPKSYTITKKTVATEKINFELPDASSVVLNANSELSYSTKKWKSNKIVTLSGEAYFKVAKGATFKVKTTDGIVTVYGTQFNVNQRDSIFEVTCYEGLVGVLYKGKETKLNPGNQFLVINSSKIETLKTTYKKPSWISNQSTFNSMPYKLVLQELERQYNVTIITENINPNLLFTGSFTHSNFNLAIKAVTLPLQASYTKTNSTVTIRGN